MLHGARAATVELAIEISGDIVERQELLNGTRIVTLEGRSPDGRWRLSALVSWNLGLEDRPPEGDLTLVRDDGAEIYATVASVERSAANGTSDDSGDDALRVTWDIDGGAGEFEPSTGRIDGDVALVGSEFTLTLAVRFTAGA